MFIISRATITVIIDKGHKRGSHAGIPLTYQMKTQYLILTIDVLLSLS
jgi:hypothetical protein